MGQPAVRIARGYDDLSESARMATRISAGHPEGYVLAFANLYRQFAKALMARQLGRPFERYLATLPSVHDGVRGMAFIEAATRSQEDEGAWTRVPE